MSRFTENRTAIPVLFLADRGVNGFIWVGAVSRCERAYNTGQEDYT